MCTALATLNISPMTSSLARDRKLETEARILGELLIAAEPRRGVVDAIELQLFAGLGRRRVDAQPPIARVALHRHAAGLADDASQIGRRLELAVRRARRRGDA